MRLHYPGMGRTRSRSALARNFARRRVCHRLHRVHPRSMKGHMNMTTSRMQQSKGMQMLGNVAHWPPLVYVLLGLALGGIWALGTSVQVLTSEAWMLHKEMRQIDFTAFGQLWDAVTGHLPPTMLVPFVFGWGVQFALIVASIGIELPSHPRWRYWLAWIAVIGLIAVNSCGDFVSSSNYGMWGQWGFTLVIFFITFCILLFAIMAFKQAWTVMRQPAS